MFRGAPAAHGEAPPAAARGVCIRTSVISLRRITSPPIRPFRDIVAENLASSQNRVAVAECVNTHLTESIGAVFRDRIALELSEGTAFADKTLNDVPGVHESLVVGRDGFVISHLGDMVHYT